MRVVTILSPARATKRAAWGSPIHRRAYNESGLLHSNGMGAGAVTDKDLKRLRRDELLEILIAQSKKMDQMQAELDAARAALDSREILLREAGSIAEAALRINGVFEAAQAAAQQYLENIRRMSGPLPEEEGVEEPETDPDAEGGQQP